MSKDRQLPAVPISKRVSGSLWCLHWRQIQTIGSPHATSIGVQIVFFFSFLLAFSSPLSAAPPDTSSDTRTASTVTETAKPQFVRRVPNQTIPFQAGKTQTTVISLDGLYADLDEFQETQPVISIASKGKKNVRPEIKDGKLILEWNASGKSEIILKIENPDTGQHFFEQIHLEASVLDYWKMAFSLVGGLGIFLFGMKFLSDGLQLVAGPALRKLIATVTSNRFLAVIVGILVTGIIQSSSATTVMVVSFVNSQIMTLAQAIGVIMGSNIGTTVTAWLLTLSLSKYGLPILGIASVFYLFSSADRTRYLAMAAMGLGSIFYGLDLMSGSFASLKDLSNFNDMFQALSGDTFGSMWVCIFVGCAITLILQSSSVTIGITMSLASLDIISFNAAAAMVLGENIGTTITAYLASIGTSINAKRSAYFHVFFNVIGVLWMSVIFLPLYLPMIKCIVGLNPETGKISDPKVGIALVHSLFNIANMILFLPFVPKAASLLEHYIAGKNGETEENLPRLTTLAMHRLEIPTMAIERSRIEVIRMGNNCLRLSEKVAKLIAAEEQEQKIIDSAFHQEEELDTLQDEITEYTAGLLSGNISHDISDAAHQQLRMADELESISDYLITILKSDLKLRKDGVSIPEPQKTSLAGLFNELTNYLAMIIQFYSARRINFDELMSETNAQGRSFTVKVKTVRDLFVKRMSVDRFEPQVVIAFNTQLNAYRRVREHAQNVAEAIAGAK